MTANIFISFAAQDRKVANTLCQALESRGFKCWISSRDILPGENFQIAIVRAIRKAKLMLLVFTANSNNSEEMNKELALASQQKLTVVPLRIEDVAPNDAFAYEFATRQWIDFFADWELAMGALASQIANVLGPDAPAEVIPATVTATVATLAETVVRAPTADITSPVEASAPAPAPEIPEAEVHATEVAESAVHEPEVHDLAAREPDLREAEAAETVLAPPADAALVFHDDADHAAGHESEPDAHPAYEPAAESPDAPVRKKGSPLPLIIGVLVLAVAAGVAAMFVLGKKAPATTTAASSAASTAATAAAPTVSLGQAASTAASSAAPVATPAGTPPQAASAAQAADTSAATAAADGGDGQKTRHHGKGASAAAPPLRATRSDIPY